MFTTKLAAIVLVFVTGCNSYGYENYRLRQKIISFCTDSLWNWGPRRQNHGTPVAFTVILTETKTFQKNQAILYNKVVTNIGSAYNKDTGYFKAPVTGLYSFSVSLMGYHSKGVHVNLMVNGNQLMRLWTDGAGKHEVASHTVYKKLQKHDQVWTTTLAASKLYGSGSDAYNQFSGVLLNRM